MPSVAYDPLGTFPIFSRKYIRTYWVFFVRKYLFPTDKIAIQTEHLISCKMQVSNGKKIVDESKLTQSMKINSETMIMKQSNREEF